MSEFFASYQDLRKIATIFRRPDIALVDCGREVGRLVVRLRIDVAQLVDAVRRFKDHLPVEVKVTLEPQLLDSQRIGIQLVDLEADAKAIPKIVRKLAMPMVRRSIFDRIPEGNGITVEKANERIIVDIGQILKEGQSPISCGVTRIEVEPEGLRVHLSIDAANADES